MKKTGLIVLTILSVLFICQCLRAEEPNLPKDANQVVMVFDGKELTLKQIGYLSPNLNYTVAADIADFWLNTQLLYEEAVKRDIDKDDRVKFLADINSKKTVASALIAKVGKDVKVTDKDVHEYYKQNKATDPNLSEPTYLSFTHITLNSLPNAQTMLKKINEGNDIDLLAREFSISSDAQTSGKVNKFPENTIKAQFGAEFLEALLNATEGQIIGPVKCEDGKYEIARHEGKRAPKLKDFAEVQQMIKTNLENQAREKAVNSLIDSLKEKAKQR